MHPVLKLIRLLSSPLVRGMTVHEKAAVLKILDAVEGDVIDPDEWENPPREEDFKAMLRTIADEIRRA